MNEITHATTETTKQDITQIATDYLQSIGCKLAKPDQIKFIEICKAFRLNPFLREVYGIPYKDSFNIIVGYEVYLKRAESTGLLKGWKAWTEQDEKSKELKAIIEIKRNDWTEPFKHEVYFSEYKQNNRMWQEKPKTMIKKVAISQGFRLAFPVELGGLPYTAEELPLTSINNVVDVMPYHTPKQESEQTEPSQPEKSFEIEDAAHQDQPDEPLESMANLDTKESLYIQETMTSIKLIENKNELKNFIDKLKISEDFLELTDTERELILEKSRKRYKTLQSFCS